MVERETLMVGEMIIVFDFFCFGQETYFVQDLGKYNSRIDKGVVSKDPAVF